MGKNIGQMGLVAESCHISATLKRPVWCKKMNGPRDRCQAAEGQTSLVQPEV